MAESGWLPSIRSNVRRYVVLNINLLAKYYNVFFFVSDHQFPIDLTSVQKDNPFLDFDSSQSLFRRLNTLNRCANVKVESWRSSQVNINYIYFPVKHNLQINIYSCLFHAVKFKINYFLLFSILSNIY